MPVPVPLAAAAAAAAQAERTDRSMADSTASRMGCTRIYSSTNLVDATASDVSRTISSRSFSLLRARGLNAYIHPYIGLTQVSYKQASKES